MPRDLAPSTNSAAPAQQAEASHDFTNHARA
jgi:hypothetical protein